MAYHTHTWCFFFTAVYRLDPQTNYFLNHQREGNKQNNWMVTSPGLEKQNKTITIMEHVKNNIKF